MRSSTQLAFMPQDLVEEGIRVLVIVVVGDDAASVSVSIGVIVPLVPIITIGSNVLHRIS